MPDTGAVNHLQGVYKGRCGHEHFFSPGDRFTRCQYCNRPTNWIWMGRDLIFMKTERM